MKRLLVCAGLILLASGICAGATLNVMDFGAKANGKKDDSYAIQKALDKCAVRGGVVNLPAGKYRLNAPIKVPTGVTLLGEWHGPHFPSLDKGTVILCYAGKGKEHNPPLISLSPNSTIQGVTVFYPEQQVPDVQPYPWTIHGEGTHCNVIDVTLVNPYKGIDFGTKPNELHYIRNVYGCPLKTGVYINWTTDIGRVENVHFNPNSWNRMKVDNAPKAEDLIKYLGENCTAFEIGRTDWEYMVNTFSYGCKIGYRFFLSPQGNCNGNFLGIAADWARTAILVEAAQMPGLLITNGEFVGAPGAEAIVEIAASNKGVVQLSNCSFWGAAQRIVRTAGGTVNLSQCNFCDFEHGRKEPHAVEASGGSITITGCRFGGEMSYIKLEQGLKTAAIVGNTFGVDVSVRNDSDAAVTMSGNIAPKPKTP